MAKVGKPKPASTDGNELFLVGYVFLVLAHGGGQVCFFLLSVRRSVSPFARPFVPSFARSYFHCVLFIFASFCFPGFVRFLFRIFVSFVISFVRAFARSFVRSVFLSFVRSFARSLLSFFLSLCLSSLAPSSE